MKKTLKLLGVLFFLASCKSENEQRIVGKWQAAQLMECDNLVPIQTELVDIEFSSEGNYVFHSTLNVKEEGTYRIKKNYLFTQDKLREKAPEKAVLIKSITEDSMVLQMSYKGKDQYLTLIKEGVSEKGREKEEQSSKSKALAIAAGTATAAAATAVAMPNNPLDSVKGVEAAKKAEEEKKKQTEADKAAERKKEEAAADKRREAEADRKREEAKKKSKKEETSSSSSEAYKKREAKRKAEERKAKEEADKKAEKFRKEYAKREAEKKKKK